jgi:hypothetical protein
MSTAHWHLILTHIPILGVPAALALLMWGLYKKSCDLRNVALFVFVLCGVFSFAAEQTGEGAEDQIKKNLEFSKSITHQHEEMGEKAAIVTGLLGLAALGTFGLSLRRKPLPAATFPVLIALALGSSGTLLYTGALGGPVRHSEIRADSLTPGVPTNGASQKDDD